MKQVKIWTDGACSGNPGAGGWGAVLKYNTTTKELSGNHPDTTNNRMELTGVIEALRVLREPCDVTLTTDSRYVVDAIEKGWLQSWQAGGWRKSNRKPVINADLWKTLLSLLEVHQVKFVWVRGHNGNPENERCDELAVGSYLKIKK